MEALCDVPFNYAKAQIVRTSFPSMLVKYIAHALLEQSAGAALPSMIASNMDGGMTPQQEEYLSIAAAALYSGRDW